MKKLTGFTLIEILIAVAILSIIAVIMTRALHVMIITNQRVEVTSNRITQLQLTINLLQQDLQQLVNRPIINENGQLENAVTFSALAPIQLSFTRGGFVNPNSFAQRSTLERVTYQLKDDQLQRLSWPVLDRVSTTQPNVKILLDHVSNLSWRFLDDNNNFSTTWPTSGQILPKAIEIHLTLSDWGEMTQLIIVNGSDPKK